jgi:hypothetical protein
MGHEQATSRLEQVQQLSQSFDRLVGVRKQPAISLKGIYGITSPVTPA